MRKLFFVIASLVASAVLSAQSPTQTPAAPELEFALQLRVELGETFSCGETQHGTRIVIPITGGTFEGPEIKGTILPGGADYQLGNAALNRTEVEAIYCIRTDDGVSIHVRNWGIICSGDGGFYFTCQPKFEAPADSKYAWINNKVFVCRPDFSANTGGITLNVWYVK